jgi:amino acid adenylation domain-containing protein
VISSTTGTALPEGQGEGFRSLVAGLRQRASETPDRRACTFLLDGETEAAHLTYGELDRRARALGGEMQQRGLQGTRALLLFPPGLDFIAAFFGCLYGGVVAVPTYPPRAHRLQPRLRAIARDANPRVVLTTAAIRAKATLLAEQVPEVRDLPWLEVDVPDLGDAGGWSDPEPRSDSLAFLQYTSGSTSAPKGVMVTQGNLVHNQAMIRLAFEQDETSVIVGWLPLYHDMGLIGNVLQPLYVGARCVLMSPQSFLQRPLRWLEAISRHGATTSGGPSFAYELCARKVHAGELPGLDLSRWQVAFNGAEPVRAGVMERFAEVFAPAGFRREAFYPCYGLAEATLFAAGGTRWSPPRVRAFEASALERNLAVAATDATVAARRLVGCGHAWLEQEIAIVDPTTAEPCEEGGVGEIWISGPSVAAGYWQRDEETRWAFRAELSGGAGRFLRTGDLGVLADGELFVTGRLKDLIILRGRNLYPQDIELTVEGSHPSLRPGCGAAFAVEVGGEERLVVVQEVERRRREGIDVEAVAAAIRRAVAAEHEASIHEVVLLEAGGLPKTSSGKVQRHACRAGYLAGTLEAVGRSAVPLGFVEGAAGGPAPVRDELLALLPDERLSALAAYLAERVAHLTGMPLDLAEDGSLSGLGLDSLMAVELRNALEGSLRIALPLTSILRATGPVDLATEILAALDEPAAITIGLADLPEPVAGEQALSDGQRGLWLLEQMAPGLGVCNLGGAARTRSPVNPATLQRAFCRLAQRHPALRTTFGIRGDEPYQRVEPDLAPAFVVHDASRWSAAELSERLREELYRPFDLERGPLLRAGLWRLDGGESVLSLGVHHLVADLGSLAVMMRDLGALYSEEEGGAAAALAPVPISFLDHLRRQEERIAGEAGDRLRAYWHDRLTAPLPGTELPTDRPRPPVQTYEGSAVTLRLPGEVADRLRALGRVRGASLYTILAGSFLALLHRYTGQRDLIIGSPTSGRGAAGLDHLVAYLVNPVALRVGVDGDSSFAALLERVRESVFGAFDHMDYPFIRLVEELQPARDVSRAPIFQLAFALQRAHLPELAGLGGFVLGEGEAEIDCGGLRLSSLEARPERVQFDLMLVAAERGHALGFAVQYATALFDRVTIERFAEHFGRLTTAALDSPQIPLADLPLLGLEEEHQLLVEWNVTASLYDREAGLYALFAAQAAERPEAPALGFEGVWWSYGDLARRAEELADVLLGLGVGPEVLVGIAMERSLEMVAALLAVLAAGGAYVPMDPSYPEERLAFMLEDSRISVLLTQKRLVGRFPAVAVPLVLVDLGQVVGAGPAGARPPGLVRPESLAYVIYTSGSTGRPKGVQIANAAVINLLTSLRDRLGFTRADVLLAVTTLSFDIAGLELFLPLISGARVEIVTAETAANGERLRAVLDRNEVTVMQATPATWRLLLDAGWKGSRELSILCGGEALPRDLSERLLEASGSLWNVYGPTETTIWSTGLRVLPDGVAGSIGRPLANTRIHLLSRELAALPAGVPGELHIGGDGLSRGYRGRPDLTAERFVPDPFSTARGEAGARLYRTGDLARYLPDGELQFLGRLDHQVKVRGFRIELGEVESALAVYPGVSAAAVIVRQDLPGGPGLAAFLVMAVGEGPGIGALRDHLASCLPGYMIPARFAVLAALPLTPNGKVDRKALAGVRLERAAEVDGRIMRPAPPNPLQEMLAALFAEVLGLEAVDLHESFFALGGHSLLAIQLASRVRRAHGVELPLRTLFERPTVAALSEAVAALLGREQVGPAPPLVAARQSAAVLPLSFAQERLWFLDQLDPGSATYNMPLVLHLQGQLSWPVLAASLSAVVARHEALRTVFADYDGRPVQVVLPELRLAPPVIDLTALSEERRQEEARALAVAEAARPFELARGPLVRATLLRLSPAAGDGVEERHWFLLNVHHIVADGWSLGVLVREMTELYAALREGRGPRLPELTVQYGDYALWQRSWFDGEGLGGYLEWWRTRLPEAPEVLDLPLDRPRPAVQRYRGEHLLMPLSSALSRSLAGQARSGEATLFMILLAAFQSLLLRLSGREMLVVGSPFANRDRVELEALIGFFVNTLPLPGDLRGDPTFTELLARTRETILGAYAHRAVPFEKLVDELKPERSLAHSPLFQVMLVLQNAPLGTPVLPGVAVQPVAAEGVGAKFDVTLYVTETPQGLACTWEYNPDLFDAPTMVRMAGSLENLAVGAMQSPWSRLSELPLLAGAERHQLVTAWNDTAVAYPGRPIHEIFAEQAVRRPAAPALVFEGETLSYGELDRRADQLARYLRSRGVSPGDLVGICMERSFELLVALLGVLKAGAAYVPLDPEYPRERLTFMLEDCAVSFLLLQERLGSKVLDGGLAPLTRGIAVDAEWEQIAAEKSMLPPCAADLEGLAYVIYTSGSTGRPKGAMNSHRGIANRLLWMQARYRLEADDRVLQKTPFSFDVSVWELFWPLMTGACLVIARPGGHRDAAYLVDLIAREGITTVHFVPSMLRAFLEQEGLERCGSLRRVVCSGEALSFELQQRFFARLEAELHNLYGPTEASVDVTFHACVPGDRRGIVPLGRPIANLRLLVVDRWARPVPIGVTGELWIGGAGLGLGYIGRPDLTAERFVPAPVGEEPGERFYRSGDLVRYLSDGAVEFLGRLDDQVKIRGFRIELGEIESALCEVAEVAQAVVLARAGATGDRRLVAYVVPREGTRLEVADLRQRLLRRLPEFMVPTVFMVLAEMPLTFSGKVDRRALPAPEAPRGGGPETRPRTPVEALLAAIWTDLLRRGGVGLHDNFFELGGDSILGIQVVARAARAGCRITPKQIFERQTIAELAQVASAAAETPTIRRISREGYRVKAETFEKRFQSGT